MGQAGLDTIKTNIKTILDAANTTTASPVDLSSGLNNRVVQVLKINPARIMPQPSYFPFVTMYYEKKDVELQGIARNQTTARRFGDVDLVIMGLVSENIVTSDLEDEADEQVEKLMENIEEVIRDDDTLNGAALSHAPDDIVYHTTKLDEQTIIRAGKMTLEIRVDY